MNNGRTFTIRTLGCKANQYDSQLLREELLRRGFVECDGKGDADVSIINTCTVTAESDAKSRQAVRALKRSNPRSRVVVTGCYAHVNPDEVGAIDGVDAVIDNTGKKELAERIGELLEVESRRSEARWSRISFFSGHTRAFVKIQDGCDKRCSYCIVPFARGGSRNREIPDILSEIEGLVANGYREVVLTGIHIGSFGVEEGRQENRLAELLKSLRGIKGLIRVRLSSIDLNEVSDRLVEAMRDSPQVCHHLHIPLQSGSDAILRRMNRDYTRDGFLDTVAHLKKELPDISITTDVMVGFPSETEQDFEESLRLVREAEFGKVHVFPFSNRPGTLAERLPNHVPSKVIDERIARMSAQARDAALRSRERFRGKVVEVLVEREFSPRTEKQIPIFLKSGGKAYEGFSANYLRTVFPSSGENIEQLKNRLVQVQIEAFDERYLYGQRV